MAMANASVLLDEIRALAAKVRDARNSDESLDYSRQLRVKTQELEELAYAHVKTVSDRDNIPNAVQRAPQRNLQLCGAEAVAPDSRELMKCRLVDGHSPTNIHRDGITFYWDDREIRTSWPSRIPETCALCGKHNSSHVAVRDGDNLVADRLCASHTFYDVIRTGKFFVEVSVSHDL